MAEQKEDKKDKFSEILDRVMESVKKVKSDPPMVSESSVEQFAKNMVGFGYDLTTDTLGILVDYLKGYNLWLCGNVGVGKTFFFDCISKIRSVMGYSTLVKLSMIETQGWTMDDAKEWVLDNADRDVVIDDIGTEPLMKSYGQEAELFPYLLEKRMQLVTRRTHLTSNLGIIDIKKRYGERVADRFVQFFKMEVMKSKKSKRVLKPWKKVVNGWCVP